MEEVDGRDEVADRSVGRAGVHGEGAPDCRRDPHQALDAAQIPRGRFSDQRRERHSRPHDGLVLPDVDVGEGAVELHDETADAAIPDEEIVTAADHLDGEPLAGGERERQPEIFEVPRNDQNVGGAAHAERSVQAQGLVMVEFASDRFGHRGLPGSRSRKRGAPPGPVPGDTPTIVQRTSKNDARYNSLTGQQFSIYAGRGPGLSRAKADTDCSAGDARGPSVGREGRGERGGPGRSSARPAPSPPEAVRGHADRRFGRAGLPVAQERPEGRAHGAGADRHTPSPAPTRTFSRGGPPAVVGDGRGRTRGLPTPHPTPGRTPPAATAAEPRTAVFSSVPGDATARAPLRAALTPGAGSRTRAAPPPRRPGGLPNRTVPGAGRC